jgi:lipopolysaccharide biosynthesis protein
MVKIDKKYISVFAHFDRDSLIDDYVLYYLEELKKASPEIVFVSDCNVSDAETKKLSNLCFHNICKRHEEYDFGSYKRGIEFLKDSLKEYDYLVLANDSCYGPIKPLLPIFKEMEERNLDFWGMTTNTSKSPEHIQSYFLVFSKKVFLSKEFSSFFAAVKKQKTKMDVVKQYEVRLTQMLAEAGFEKGSFVNKVFEICPIMSWEVCCSLLSQGFPFVKVRAAMLNPNPPLLKRLVEELASKTLLGIIFKKFTKFPDINWQRFFTNHQISLISKHLNRIGFAEELRIKILSQKFFLLLIKKGIFRIKFLGITMVKRKAKLSKLKI